MMLAPSLNSVRACVPMEVYVMEVKLANKCRHCHGKQATGRSQKDNDCDEKIK